ncbi:hypothetical protein O1611_g7452 [Lasiodiplodia mahajangana]|uniref:Uncharacterized protein n=1 Tax=Lasiodiplodia mahajangana TaxID=1108764 RepID=A0ACC2JFB0_9PEZI|nr:hypothetical protein O1611_g7452 [Lasiodiplodia mahajangana]
MNRTEQLRNVFAPGLRPAQPEGVTGPSYSVKNLYNHASSRGSEAFQWSEFEDVAAEERRVKDLTKAFAIIHKFSPTEKDGVKTWVTHSIEVQSPKLKQALDRIFADYTSWYSDTSPYVAYPPFKPYVHRWDRILESTEPIEGKPDDALCILRRELEPLLKLQLSAMKKVKTSGVISFDMLWLIFAPDTLVASQENGNTCIYRLLSAKLVPRSWSKPEHWLLEQAQMEWNGSCCGIKSVEMRINKSREDQRPRPGSWTKVRIPSRHAR